MKILRWINKTIGWVPILFVSIIILFMVGIGRGAAKETEKAENTYDKTVKCYSGQNNIYYDSRQYSTKANVLFRQNYPAFVVSYPNGRQDVVMGNCVVTGGSE